MPLSYWVPACGKFIGNANGAKLQGSLRLQGSKLCQPREAARQPAAQIAATSGNQRSGASSAREQQAAQFEAENRARRRWTLEDSGARFARNAALG